MKIQGIFATCILLMSTNVYSEDLRDSIFGLSSTAIFHEDSALTNQSVEELITKQSAFSGNFCQICSCCTENAINWALVSDEMIEQLGVAQITIVPETQIQAIQSTLEKSKLAEMDSSELHSQYQSTFITANEEFCDECDCCDEENRFSPERAKEAKFVSIESKLMDDLSSNDINRAVTNCAVTNCAVTGFLPVDLTNGMIEFLRR